MKCPDCFKKMSLEDEQDDSTMRCFECSPRDGMYLSYSGSRYFAEYRKGGLNPCTLGAYGSTALEAEVNLKTAIKEIYKNLFNVK